MIINYLIDIDHSLSESLINLGGIDRIVLLTTNIEFIDLAENAIKVSNSININIYITIKIKIKIKRSLKSKFEL